MASPLPGPYSGTSTLALVARASAFTFGLVYGNLKLKVLKIYRELLYSLFSVGTHPLVVICTFWLLEPVGLLSQYYELDGFYSVTAKANSHAKAEAKAHH